MSLQDLIASVDSVQSGDDYWRVQRRLALEVEAHELRIERTKRRHQRFRAAIRRYSEKPDRTSPGSAERFRRLQGLLSRNDVLEEQHRLDRGAALYLGDVLAYNLMPDHVVRLHGRNSRPGFFRGKTGRALELEIGDFLTNDGWTVMLHDLSHCLRIGDLTAFCENRGIWSLEVGAGSKARKMRQSKRMHLLNSVLKEDVTGIRPDDLIAHSLPTNIVEDGNDFDHNTSSFVEVAGSLSTGCKVVKPEEGVLYVAWARECEVADILRELRIASHAAQNCLLASFSDRIAGKFSWVPPILSLSIPRDLICGLLRGDFRFWTFLDVDHIKRRLAEIAPAVTVTVESDCLEMFVAGQNGLSILGLRPVENVQYGLATLESALRMLAARARLEPRETDKDSQTALE
jgi:hypothetical protein